MEENKLAKVNLMFVFKQRQKRDETNSNLFLLLSTRLKESL